MKGERKLFIDAWLGRPLLSSIFHDYMFEPFTNYIFSLVRCVAEASNKTPLHHLSTLNTAITGKETIKMPHQSSAQLSIMVGSLMT